MHCSQPKKVSFDTLKLWDEFSIPDVSIYDLDVGAFMGVKAFTSGRCEITTTPWGHECGMINLSDGLSDSLLILR